MADDAAIAAIAVIASRLVRHKKNLFGATIGFLLCIAVARSGEKPLQSVKEIINVQ
jgi:hypothetical protein